MAYLLDSNVFIHAKNLHYGFDFCPASVGQGARQGTHSFTKSAMTC